MHNCTTCKWGKILLAFQRDRKGTEARLGYSENAVLAHCDECVAAFAKTWRGVCRDCAWKDRNLPYWQRTRHCEACAKAFAATSGMKCEGCKWNNPQSRQPTDASLAHCKACLDATGSTKGAMGCEGCPAMKIPTERRRAACMKCSLKFSQNQMVVGGTNELSNGGETFISYDNHNAAMTDDRDVAMQISPDFVASRRPSAHPATSLKRLPGESEEQVTKRVIDMMNEFLKQLAALPDIQILLFMSKLRGDAQTKFAFSHGLSDSTVSTLYKKLVMTSPVFREFMKGIGIAGVDEVAKKVEEEGLVRRKKTATRTKYVDIRQMEFDFTSEKK